MSNVVIKTKINKGIVQGINLLIQKNFYKGDFEKYIHHTLAYNSGFFNSPAAVISYTVLYCLYFYDANKDNLFGYSRNVFLKSYTNSAILQQILEIQGKYYRKSKYGSRFSKLDFMMYMTTSILRYLLVRSERKNYEQNNSIIFYIATIQQIIPKNIMASYIKKKYVSEITQAHRVIKQYLKNYINYYDPLTLFQFNMDKEIEYFPIDAWDSLETPIVYTAKPKVDSRLYRKPWTFKNRKYNN